MVRKGGGQQVRSDQISLLLRIAGEGRRRAGQIRSDQSSSTHCGCWLIITWCPCCCQCTSRGDTVAGWGGGGTADQSCSITAGGAMNTLLLRLSFVVEVEDVWNIVMSWYMVPGSCRCCCWWCFRSWHVAVSFYHGHYFIIIIVAVRQRAAWALTLLLLF